jgi:hypothetical protein
LELFWGEPELYFIDAPAPRCMTGIRVHDNSSLNSTTMSCSRETVSGTNKFAGGFESVTFAI